MDIDVAIHPQHLDHFKSQLLRFEVQGSSVRILYDGGGFQDRHSLMTELVKRSFEDNSSNRTLKFWVFTGDNRPAQIISGEPLFTISGNRLTSDFILPDPHILRWPQIGVTDFRAYCDSMLTESQATSPQIMSTVWRGSIDQHVIRKQAVEFARRENSSLLDMKHVSISDDRDSIVEMKDLNKWAIMADFPGRGFSGRLKYLMHSIRPKLVFEREEWDAFTCFLEPGVHYMNCPPDTHVILHTIKKILNNYSYYTKMAFDTSRLMSSLTQRKIVSNIMASKIAKYV